MKKIILSLMLFKSTWSLAQAEYCTLHSEDPEKIVHVNDSPSFFAKAKAQGDYIFYIGSSGNRLLSTTDTDDATRDLPIFGSIDPVPSPDGKILTIPGVSIYSMDDVISKRENARPIFRDPTNDGVYQSVALVKIDPSNSNIRTYRVVVDGDAQIQYRDYEINFNETPIKVTPLRETKVHCPNQSVSTIMVSKTGRYVTGFDRELNTTKIFDMTDLNGNDRCRELYDLGYGTGKIEFNIAPPRQGQAFNFEDSDKRIAFHLDYFSSNVGSYFSGVESGMAKDIFTIDLVAPQSRTGNWKLKPENVRKIFSEATLGSGGYYPSFTNDGRIVAIFDNDDSYSFRFWDPNRTKPYDFYLVPPAENFETAWRDESRLPPNWKERFHRAATIGVLWSQVCLPEDTGQRKDIDAVGATTYFLGMTKESCTQLVNSNWDAMKPQIVANPIWGRDPRFSTRIIGGYGPNELLQSCAAIKEREPAREPTVIGTPSASHLRHDQLMHHYCQGCHVPGGRNTGILGDPYPNTVNFYRSPLDEPYTTLAHLLSSKRRVQTGLKHDEDPQGRRPPDSMPPFNRIEPAERTDFDHGQGVLEIITNDIAAVSTLPKRVPLYLRDEERQQQLSNAAAGGRPSGIVQILADGQPVTSFNMTSHHRRQAVSQTFELVNGTNQELTEIGASDLRGVFYYGGRNLFPGEGNCGATLAAGARCTFSVGFSARRHDMFVSSVQINYVVRDNNRRTPGLPVILALEGLVD